MNSILVGYYLTNRNLTGCDVLGTETTLTDDLRLNWHEISCINKEFE